MMRTVLWERPLHQRGTGRGLAAAGDRVVVHERGTRLVGLVPADGTAAWDVASGTWPRSLVVVGDRCLVLPQAPARLSCLDLSGGSELWRVELPPYRGHVVAARDTVLVGGWRGYTPQSAYTLRDGRLLWRQREPVSTTLPVSWAGGVLTGNGSVVRLIEPHDGSLIARWQLPERLIDTDVGSAFVVLGSDRCLVACDQGSLMVLDRGSGTADELVRVDEPDRGDPDRRAAELVGGLLWGYGRRVIDPVDGTVQFRLDPDTQLVEGVVRAGDGFVVGTRDGKLVGLGPDGQVVARCPHGRRIRALRDLRDGTVLVMTKGPLQRVAVEL